METKFTGGSAAVQSSPSISKCIVFNTIIRTREDLQKEVVKFTNEPRWLLIDSTFFVHDYWTQAQILAEVLVKYPDIFLFSLTSNGESGTEIGIATHDFSPNEIARTSEISPFAFSQAFRERILNRFGMTWMPLSCSPPILGISNRRTVVGMICSLKNKEIARFQAHVLLRNISKEVPEPLFDLQGATVEILNRRFPIRNDLRFLYALEGKSFSLCRRFIGHLYFLMDKFPRIMHVLRVFSIPFRRILRLPKNVDQLETGVNYWNKSAKL